MQHMALKKSLQQREEPKWKEIAQFVDECMRLSFPSSGGSSLRETYSFGDMAHVVDLMGRRFGKWQDGDCRLMRSALMERGSSGRVHLGAFYAPSNTSAFRFIETEEYLRAIGALEELPNGGHNVLVANFVAGPSNCIAIHEYSSVCCLNECDAVMSEIEGQLKTPLAMPRDVTLIVEKVLSTSRSLHAPSRFTPELKQKLGDIAARHGGLVPLYGRLFAQWLHFVLPNDCPYPRSSSEAATRIHISPDDYHESEHFSVSSEGLKIRMEAAIGLSRPSELPMLNWVDEEDLFLQEPPKEIVIGGQMHVFVLSASSLITLFMVLGLQRRLRARLCCWCCQDSTLTRKPCSLAETA